MYSVTFGLVNPKLYSKDISSFKFYDISEEVSDTYILIDLMKSVLDPANNNNIVHVFEDFFDKRKINLSNNKSYQKITEFFLEYRRWYMGRNKSAFKCYLVKRRKDDQVVDIIKQWKTYREIDSKETRKKVYRD